MRLHAKKWIVKNFNSLFSSPKMSLILITNEEEVRTERKAPNTCRLKSLKQGVVHNKLWEAETSCSGMEMIGRNK
jgi:hypothetical protein